MLDQGPAYVLGALPSWLELGPVQEMDGVPVRAILGDWSHLHECDQPPKFVIDGILPHEPIDRSDTRPPVPQRLPGKPITHLKGIHSGRVAIFFNGQTLKDHDLHRVRQAGIPIIGMNRTHVGFPGYDGPQPDYLCIVDNIWLTKPEVRAHPALINGGHNADHVGYRAARHFRMRPFSFDLWYDGYAPDTPCTTGSLALQLAVYMGFEEIYCLGLDLGGSHFGGAHGSTDPRTYPRANNLHKLQAPLLARRGVSVYVCGSPRSRCTAFPHAPFEALFS